jgi:hypothetical protein
MLEDIEIMYVLCTVYHDEQIAHEESLMEEITSPKLLLFPSKRWSHEFKYYYFVRDTEISVLHVQYVHCACRDCALMFSKRLCFSVVEKIKCKNLNCFLEITQRPSMGDFENLQKQLIIPTIFHAESRL